MKILLWLAVFLALFFLYARYMERNSIYFPFKEIRVTPETVGLEFEDIYFNTADGKKLNGWFVPKRGAKFTIFLCHGNAGNIGDRTGKIDLFNKWGYDVFVFDYRGYGKSEGSPTETGLYNDAKAAYDYLVKERKINPENIIFYGESLGGAVVIDLACAEKGKAIITGEAFTSVKDMARIVYPFIPGFVLSTKYDSLSKIDKIDMPKLIIHSADDEIVPFYLGEKLFNAARPPKKFLRITGSHNDAFFESAREIKNGMEEFLSAEN